MRRASILRSKILAEVGFTSTEHLNHPWVKPPTARETKNAPSGARQVKCPADSKTGAFAPYKHFAPAKSWRRANSLRPSISIPDPGFQKRSGLQCKPLLFWSRVRESNPPSRLGKHRCDYFSIAAESLKSLYFQSFFGFSGSRPFMNFRKFLLVFQKNRVTIE